MLIIILKFTNLNYEQFLNVIFDVFFTMYSNLYSYI
jgi:hypothetical protein